MAAPRHRLALAAALVAAAALPASAVTLTFDDAPAPFNFIDARPLVDQYAALGVRFGGNGAVLDNTIADFGITGHSPPNVVGYTFGQPYRGSARVSALSDTIRFSAPQTAVSFDVGAGFSPFALDVTTFDALGGILGTTSLTLGSTLQTITLGGGFTSLSFALVGGNESSAFALDNLTFAEGPAFAPVAEPLSLALLGFGAAGLAVARRKRA